MSDPNRVLDLGKVPAADHFPPASEAIGEDEVSHPLAMVLCSRCGLAQLAADDTVTAEPRGIEPQALKEQAAEAVGRVRESGLLRGATVREYGSPHGGTWLPLLAGHGFTPCGGPADVVIDSFGIMHDPDQRAAFAERAAATAPDGRRDASGDISRYDLVMDREGRRPPADGGYAMGKRSERPDLVVAGDAPPRRNRVNFFELAYQRIEEKLVTCELKPGRFLTVQELQVATGLGRTPVHNAVNRLAADTLIVIRPRHGLQIAPIDLARERMLLHLRRDIERFVVKLAAEQASLSHRNQMLHVERLLKEKRDTITLAEFNQLDRRIDGLVLSAAGEPFLEHTLRPLHTLFRRIGFIHHSVIQSRQDLAETVDCHLALLSAIAKRSVERAEAASDDLIRFVESMFDAMESGIDPSLLDCSIEPLLGP